MEIHEYLGIRDSILNISITPNRPDCLGIIGISREIAAITGRPLKKHPSSPGSCDDRDIAKMISIENEMPSLCKRYTARIVEGVTVRPSPLWLKKRLEIHGIRAINNLVDITNYVMLEFGQPLHAFDYDLLDKRRIVVRFAEDGESIETLDGIIRALTKEVPVIADGTGPVALAGIMGGNRTEIGEETQRVLLECAFFDPASIRRASRRLGLSSESSYRFERGVNIEGIGPVIDRAAEMISEIADGRVICGCVDVYPDKYVPPKIEVNTDRINSLLGTDIKEASIKQILKRLGIELKTSRKKGVFIALPPAYRLDIEREADLIEEVARLTSYENIPSTLPKARISPVEKGRMLEVNDTAREILSDYGFFEVINYSFVAQSTFNIADIDKTEAISLLNPLSEEQTVLRGYLFPSLLETLKYNINRENRDIRIFEIGRTFEPDDRLPVEREHIAGLIYGHRYGLSWNQPKDPVDFYDIKGSVEHLLDRLKISNASFDRSKDIPFLHPGKSARLFLDNDEAGFIGEVHPATLKALDIEESAYIFEVSADIFSRYYMPFGKYKAIPKYPAIKRDISFITDRTIEYKKIPQYIRSLDAKIIEDVELFDVYCGRNIVKEKVSMAIRITYRSIERTLTDEEVSRFHSRILRELTDHFKIEIRDVESNTVKL
jgi:phenylalanyl-tRNA synthetase beta chain